MFSLELKNPQGVIKKYQPKQCNIMSSGKSLKMIIHLDHVKHHDPTASLLHPKLQNLDHVKHQQNKPLYNMTGRGFQMLKWNFFDRIVIKGL